MRISIKLIESNDVIVKKIHKAILEDVNRAFKQAESEILDKIRKTIKFLLESTSTYQSLVGGQLAGEFGFNAGGEKARVDAIIQQVMDSIHINMKEFKLSGGVYKNKIYIYIMPGDFKDLLSLPEATLNTGNEQLEWLDWLLTKGNRIIVSGFRIIRRPGRGRSRKGIMVESNNKFWRVPPQFSGTIRNNWLTRAIDDNVANLETAFARIIESELSKVL